MGLFLITVSQKGRSGSIEGKLRGRAVQIGRADDADLHLPGDNVSRRHCRLEVIGGVLAVSDLDSTNGTYVNGDEVRATRRLRPDDVVSVGHYRIQARWLEDWRDDGPPRSRHGGGGEAKEKRNRPTSREQAPSTASPWETLGVSPKAPLEEIRRAYLQLARQYHPDRLDGLAPELVALAEQRMRELNAAWEALRAGVN